MSARLVFAWDLRVGDRFLRSPSDGGSAVTVEILGRWEPHQDLFGQNMRRAWCRREDTGAEGWMVFGERGVAIKAKP